MNIQSIKCILDAYYCALGSLGYFSYEDVYQILEYIALQELGNYAVDNEQCNYENFIKQELRYLESNSSLISKCRMCNNTNKSTISNRVFGFQDSTNTVYYDRILEEIKDAYLKNNFFTVI